MRDVQKEISKIYMFFIFILIGSSIFNAIYLTNLFAEENRENSIFSSYLVDFSESEYDLLAANIESKIKDEKIIDVVISNEIYLSSLADKEMEFYIQFLCVSNISEFVKITNGSVFVWNTEENIDSSNFILMDMRLSYLLEKNMNCNLEVGEDLICSVSKNYKNLSISLTYSGEFKIFDDLDVERLFNVSKFYEFIVNNQLRTVKLSNKHSRLLLIIPFSMGKQMAMYFNPNIISYDSISLVSFFHKLVGFVGGDFLRDHMKELQALDHSFHKINPSKINSLHLMNGGIINDLYELEQTISRNENYILQWFVLLIVSVEMTRVVLFFLYKVKITKQMRVYTQLGYNCSSIQKFGLKNLIREYFRYSSLSILCAIIASFIFKINLSLMIGFWVMVFLISVISYSGLTKYFYRVLIIDDFYNADLGFEKSNSRTQRIFKPLLNIVAGICLMVFIIFLLTPFQVLIEYEHGNNILASLIMNMFISSQRWIMVAIVVIPLFLLLNFADKIKELIKNISKLALNKIIPEDHKLSFFKIQEHKMNLSKIYIAIWISSIILVGLVNNSIVTITAQNTQNQYLREPYDLSVEYFELQTLSINIFGDLTAIESINSRVFLNSYIKLKEDGEFSQIFPISVISINCSNYLNNVSKKFIKIKEMTADSIQMLFQMLEQDSFSILISEGLANTMKYSIGEEITIKNYLDSQETLKIIGIIQSGPGLDIDDIKGQNVKIVRNDLNVMNKAQEEISKIDIMVKLHSNGDPLAVKKILLRDHGEYIKKIVISEKIKESQMNIIERTISYIVFLNFSYVFYITNQQEYLSRTKEFSKLTKMGYSLRSLKRGLIVELSIKIIILSLIGVILSIIVSLIRAKAYYLLSIFNIETDYLIFRISYNQQGGQGLRGRMLSFDFCIDPVPLIVIFFLIFVIIGALNKEGNRNGTK